MKRNQHSILNTRSLVMMALLVAIQIILARYLSIQSETFRVSFETIPLALAGMWLGPLAGGDWGDLALPAGAFQASEAAEDYEAQRTAALGAVIAEKTAAYIWDKADALGVSCTVEVTVAPGESGIPLPDTVILTGPYSETLAALIQEEVGIPADKQIWREESVWSERAGDG